MSCMSDIDLSSQLDSRFRSVVSNVLCLDGYKVARQYELLVLSIFCRTDLRSPGVLSIVQTICHFSAPYVYPAG